jgi:hypothetical protein
MRKLLLPILLVIAIPMMAFGYAHPNLTDAQKLIDQSVTNITKAQEANDFDMEGHGAKAKDALEKAKGEVALAAAYADKSALFSKFLKVAGFHATPNGEPPKVNISKKKHPALAEAQQSIFDAYEKLVKAQEANEFDMEGHAQKAKDLLDTAAAELKSAAQAANKR